MGTITVANGYKTGWIGQDKVYIGRKNNPLGLFQSSLHNPYALSVYKNRNIVLKKFEDYFAELIEEAEKGKKLHQIRALCELIQRYKAGESITLTCFCKPEGCHGDTIAKYVKKYAKEWSDDFIEGQLEPTVSYPL